MKFTPFYIITVLILVLSFKNWYPDQIQHGHSIQRALPQIQNNIDNDLQELTETADEFYHLLQNHEQNFTPDEIKQYYALRKAFKSIEFVIEYWDKQFYDQRMNGAPLPKLEPKDTSIRILEPKGLQVMDEIIFGEFEASHRSELIALVKNFRLDLSHFNQTFSSNKINQRHIFEALRYNIIRQATLSITGFDTPGSLNGIQDCKTELAAVQKYLNFFTNELEIVGSRQLAHQAQEKLNQALSYLQKNQDFDQFDRLYFIQEAHNPIYKLIKDIHFALNYETWNETDTPYVQALNYKANGIFDQDFLNKFSYVSQRDDGNFEKRAALGRLLFYDPILSSSNQMACVSCHDPQKAFTDGRAKSLATDGKLFLKRNAMALPYSVYAKRLFWDIRASGLENQFEHVVTNELEFHTEYAKIVHKLKRSATYQDLFEKTYNTPNAISTNTIDYALSAYVMTMGNFNSKFDHYFQGKHSLTSSEKNGFNLFAGKAACATCHFIPTFSGLVPPFYNETESEVLGITQSENAPWQLDQDPGRYAGLIKESAEFYKHSMKTVTVRNIEKTAPYMHNGAFTSLESVMDFYNEGGGAGRGLQVEHQTLAPDSLSLSPTEIRDIIAFMKTLNDNDLPTAPDNKELPRDFDNSQWNERKIPLN